LLEFGLNIHIIVTFYNLYLWATSGLPFAAIHS
jgi:hypothetical protein